MEHCLNLKCQIPKGRGGYENHTLSKPLDNPYCRTFTHRCFRGRCRQESSETLKNTGTGLCIRALGQFSNNGRLELFPCEESVSPLDRVLLGVSGNGRTFYWPWTNRDGGGHGNKFMYAGNAEGWLAYTYNCERNDTPIFDWNMNYIDDDRF